MWASTMRAIEASLVEDTVVYGYHPEGSHINGIPGREGSFTACAFWYVECLAQAGELEKAQLRFERCSAMPTICTQNSWAQTASISGTFRRRSPSWRALTRQHIWIEYFPQLTMHPGS